MQGIDKFTRPINAFAAICHPQKTHLTAGSERINKFAYGFIDYFVFPIHIRAADKPSTYQLAALSKSQELKELINSLTDLLIILHFPSISGQQINPKHISLQLYLNRSN